MSTREAVRIARIGTSITLNTVLRTQISILGRSGFSVACICDDDEWTSELRRLGVEVLPLGMGRRPGPLRALLWGMRLYRLLRNERFDVVHTHNAFHGLVGRPIARLARAPVVTQTIHNWWYLEPRGALRPRAYALLEKLAARFCDAVFFINSDDYARAVEEGLVPARKCYLVGNGIDTTGFSACVGRASRERERSELGLRDGDIAFTMVARLEWPKDHDTLLRAFARLRAERDDVTLVLAGQGLEEGRVRRLTYELGVAPSVRFTGHCADVPGLLAASDVAVLSSGYEGFGRCLVEGMVAGLPVVGSDVPGIRDVIDDERTGLLVRASDAGALHAALRRLALDARLRSRLGAAGRVEAMTRFDEREAALRIATVYRSLLAGSSGIRRSAPGSKRGRWLRVPS
jgi:glycosyltransferase involved in cell wall biosynthesis